MTYLAPRQGLFAIIILISFLIHTTLLLISTDQQLDELKMQTGERMLVQLVEEVKLPLLSKDKVSLSVLTGRYISENQVANLTVKDIDGEAVVQTGQAQMLTGEVISKPVILSDNVIGEVALTLRDTSNGEIIASQWIFILGSFITHFLMWLIYGYIARPTKMQLAALSRDVQDHLLAHQGDRLKRARRNPLGADFDPLSHSSNDTDELDDDAEEAHDQDLDEQMQVRIQGSSGFNIHQAVNKYVQSHQGDAAKTQAHDHDSVDMPSRTATKPHNDWRQAHSHRSRQADEQGIDRSDDPSLDDADNHAGHPDKTRRQADRGGMPSVSGRALLASRVMTVATVQIHFYDPYDRLDTLAPIKAEPYFTLCTQLLEKTLAELLKQPILHNVSVKRMSRFTKDGARVELVADNEHGKAALAAVMLAKVYMMLHDVTSLKFRELRNYSADVCIGVSDEAVIDNMTHLLRHNAQSSDMLVLMPTPYLKQLNGHIQLTSLPRPRTVYERDCACLDGVSDAMMQRLVDVRNAVLLSSNQQSLH